nr:auxin transport protein BIG [Tanacetum cinerariifolium]
MYQAGNSFGDCLGPTGGCSESINALLQNTGKQEGIVEAWKFRVSDSIKTSSCWERLKDIILENGITEVAVRHLKDSFVFTGEAGFKSSPEWHSGLKLPSVLLILAMLRGLSMGHLATQKCIDEGGILSLPHEATSYTSEAIYKTRSSEKAEPLGCSSLDSLYLNCPNLSELNLNSCKALLPVSNDPLPSEDNYSRKRMADGSKRIRIPFSFSQPSPDEGKGTFQKRSETDYSMNFNDILNTYHVGECNHCVEELDKDFINETNEENKEESSQEEMIEEKISEVVSIVEKSIESNTQNEDQMFVKGTYNEKEEEILNQDVNEVNVLKVIESDNNFNMLQYHRRLHQYPITIPSLNHLLQHAQ